MKSSCFYSVLTTIQQPTPAVHRLSKTVSQLDGHLIIVGDRKGPTEYPLKGTELLTLDNQLELPLTLPRLLPVNHYTRKNTGYLLAISHGATCLYETDDDNFPAAGWKLRARETKARVVSKGPWNNVYRNFTKENIWPRGFPLDQIASSTRKAPSLGRLQKVVSPIQQCLVNESADVDAIWRLVLDKPFQFDKGPSIALKRGVWCPFNSQNTWWWPEAYPLLYLPSGCTFRMTDIWRSFVAQRCVWELDGVLTFHAADAIQHRNNHNLFRDFQDEIPGYLTNEKIRETLESIPLVSGADSVGSNLRKCYETLVEKEIFPATELKLVDAWLKDLKQLSPQPTQ